MMIKKLIKIANELDKRGLRKEADYLDSLLKIAEEDFEEEAEEDISDPDASQIVYDAIDRTIGMTHYENTFLTRNPSDESEGSVFSEAQTSDSLKTFDWEPYPHPAIMNPAQGYRANIPGVFGLIELKGLDPNTPVKMELGHKGETPFVMALVDKSDVPSELTKTEFTTILLGPGEDGLIVWTFHPGPPVAPSTTTPSEETSSVETAADAIDIGFDYAKVATLQ